MNNLKIGVALSGGGALGASHAGVLKALDEAGIVPHHITGVSAGAFVAALYCAGKSPDEILEVFEVRSFFDLFKTPRFGAGLVHTDYFQDFIKEHCPDDKFSCLKTKLSVGATNLNNGQYEIFEDGPLSEIVSASMAVPLLFHPVQIGNNTYVDGGLINNLLVDPLTEDCDFIIGVNAHYHKSLDKIEGLKEVAGRCFEIIAWNSIRENAKKCDFMMEVKGTDKYPLFDFKNTPKIFEIGYQEMKEKIDLLKSQIHSY